MDTPTESNSPGAGRGDGDEGSPLVRRLLEEMRALRTELRRVSEVAAQERAVLRADLLRAVEGQSKAVLDLDAGAAYLGMSRSTLKRRIDAKEIRRAKLGPGKQGAVRVTRAELDRYVERRTR